MWFFCPGGDAVSECQKNVEITRVRSGQQKNADQMRTENQRIEKSAGSELLLYLIINYYI